MNLPAEDVQLINQAIKASLLGGHEILKIYSTNFDVDYKDDRSPLTLADKAAHEAISKILSPLNLPILSEEGAEIPFEKRLAWRRFWMVDPLDGTKEFVKRNGEFTVNIALIENGKSIAGVIYAPVLDILYAGWVGLGAFRLKQASTHKNLDFESLKTTAEKLPAESNVGAFRIVGSRSHPSPETSAFIEQMKGEYSNIEMKSLGSSLKICMVAEGAADVYPRFAPTMEWDTAAGHGIAKAAGKEIIDHFTGSEMLYNKPNLLNNWFIVQ